MLVFLASSNNPAEIVKEYAPFATSTNTHSEMRIEDVLHTSNRYVCSTR